MRMIRSWVNTDRVPAAVEQLIVERGLEPHEALECQCGADT